MIADLTIENFKSFKQRTSIAFVASPSTALAGNLLRLPNGDRFVKSMALYGPNASGKTTVLDALYALMRFVLFSSEDQKPSARIPEFTPFALDRLSAKQPARVALTLDLEGDRFTLDVSATSTRVWNETLLHQRTLKQPGRKAAPRPLIERRWQPARKAYDTNLHPDLAPTATLSAAIEQTPPNRLLLGKLAATNSDFAGRIVRWFDEDLNFHDMHRNPYGESRVLTSTARQLRENPDFASTVERFLKDADTGISALRVVDEKTIQLVSSETDRKVEFREVTQPNLSFRHATGDGSIIHFDRGQESSGTLRFVALLAAIIQPSPRRRLVCIDELSASLHPDLVRRLIRIVHGSHFNPQGNQLLFTTHDTHLMDPKTLLRRDQITLCAKDRAGRGTTVRLDEFQDGARSDANLQKQYLEGRFGGIPRFGPTLEDVPADDEPLELVP